VGHSSKHLKKLENSYLEHPLPADSAGIRLLGSNINQELNWQKNSEKDYQKELANEETTSPSSARSEGVTFQSVLHFLEDLHKKASATSSIEEAKERSIQKIKDLEKKSYSLATENERLSKNLKAIEEDYRSLIEIMERARKMVVLQEEDRQQKVKFQMDKNGNLERVEK
jgi:RsfA family transcription factor